MPRRSRSLALCFAALALADCADPVAPPAASADALGRPTLAKASGVTDNFTMPVEFTLPPPWDPTNACGLNTTVTGSGVFHVVARATQTGTGAWHVSFSWNSHGTAAGADGSRYVFNYAINGRALDAVDAVSLPGVYQLVDHFNLLGQGGTPDLRVFFQGSFLFDGFNVTPIDATIRGDISCDPI
jgi:hypothetical protein